MTFSYGSFVFLTGQYFHYYLDLLNYTYYTIIFDVCDRIICINSTISNENIVENNGMIRVYLKPHRLISYSVSELMIKVKDDDDGE